MSSEEFKRNAEAIPHWGRTWLVVTGASRGLGAEICTEFGSALAKNSCILGIARSEKELIEKKNEFKSKDSPVKFIGCVLDLLSATSACYEKCLRRNLPDSPHTIDRCVLVHNAGSLGSLHYLRDISNSQEIKSYFDLNIGSVVSLNSVFLKTVKILLPQNPKLNIINISSLCAIKPMKAWGLYSSGKAARKMLFEILALEENGIDVLNYSPGPLEGNMQEIVRHSLGDAELRGVFQTMKDEGKLVSMNDSVKKLLALLGSGKYSTGGTFDFYDEL